MIGIIGAMQAEVDALQRQMNHPKVTAVSGVDFWQGELMGQQAVVARCGIGKVFAALCAQTMILKYRPDWILNTGVAGGLTGDLAVGDVAVATTVVQHDMDTTAFGDPAGLISGIQLVHLPADDALAARLVRVAGQNGFQVKQGTVVSGDQFISAPAKKEQLHKAFGAIACEMEGAAIGHVCYVNRIPFAVLRVISDSAGAGDGAMEYQEFMELAARRSVQIVTDFCREEVQ